MYLQPTITLIPQSITDAATRAARDRAEAVVAVVEKVEASYRGMDQVDGVDLDKAAGVVVVEDAEFPSDGAENAYAELASRSWKNHTADRESSWTDFGSVSGFLGVSQDDELVALSASNQAVRIHAGGYTNGSFEYYVRTLTGEAKVTSNPDGTLTLIEAGDYIGTNSPK